MNYPSATRPMLDWGTMNDWGATGTLPQTLDPSFSAGAPITDLSAIASPETLAQMGQGGMFDNFMGGMLGKRLGDGTRVDGWGGLAVGAGSALLNTFMGMKQYGLAKDQLAQSKKQFNINFGAQQKLTNSRLEDRQAARIASNPGAYASVGDYMKKNGI